MHSTLLVSNVRFVRAPLALRSTGLLGWTTITLNDGLDLGYIGVRRTLDRRIVLAFPERKHPGGFAQPLRLASMKELTLEDEVLGGAINLSCSVPCLLNTRPHFSVSQSEAGFEKIMQAVTLELSW